jgi:hypothetical protein
MVEGISMCSNSTLAGHGVKVKFAGHAKTPSATNQ